MHSTHSIDETCRSISVYYQNKRGLNTKIHDFLNNVSSSNYSIICCTETWLQPSVLNSEFINCDRYFTIRDDRRISELGTKRGGGVLLAVSNVFTVTEIDLDFIHEELPAIDILGAKIKSSSCSFFIFVLYIPPNFQASVYSKLFELLETLEFILNDNVYFLGDFNIPEFNNETEDRILSDKFLALKMFCNFFELDQYNNVLNLNNRLLDLILCNITCTVEKAQDVLLREDPHHPALSLYILVRSNKGDKIAVNPEESYNFRKANFTLLYEQLSLIDWSFLDDYTDCNEACDQLYNVINKLFEIFVPKKISRPCKYPPWFSRSIIHDIKSKDKLLREYNRTKDNNTHNNFKTLRAKIKRDISIAYKIFLNDVQINIHSDPKKFWSYVNGKKCVNTLPDTMIFEGNDFNKPADIANAFAVFFKSSFSTSNMTIPDVNVNINNTFSLEHVSESDVMGVLKQIKPKFTAGPDGIPAFILRDCAVVLAYPLMKIFNLCLNSRIFPDRWKLSRICPVFKKGDKNLVINHRPITIICNFSKVFEMLLHRNIYENTRGLISNYQHGFMQGRSTTTNLFCITQYISESVDSGGQVDVIYTDFSKAFDRLDHSILLFKLKQYGFSDKLADLFTSYLHCRRQYVEYRGFRSDEFIATSGVPQGSILGPLLFVIFINDIVDVIDVNCLLYADDLKLYCDIESVGDSVKLQDNVNKIDNWCTQNNLPLNVQKCNVMSYTKKNDPFLFNYKLNYTSLNRVTEFKDLGVIFDSRLSFNQHINAIVLASNRSLGFVMRHSRGFNDISILLLLFNTFVLSKLEYASIIWNPGYQTFSNSLEGIQRKFLKFASFRLDGVYPPVGVPHHDLLSRHNVLSLSRRREMHSLIFLLKIIHSKLDCPLILCQLNFNIPTIVTRRTNTFYLPTPRTNLLKFSPLFCLCTIYHSVQDNLDIFHCNIHSIKKFFFTHN